MSIEDEQKRLRSYLNPSIRGPGTDAVLNALSTGASYLINNVEQINDMLYVVTAEGQYLDQLLAGRNITRPDNVGLADEAFREIGIAISTRKQVRDLVHEILRIVYGEDFVRASIQAEELETYALENGDNLIVSFDDQPPVTIVFKASQFSNINSATAQEVSDAITKETRRLGRKGSAIAKDDGIGGYPVLISETNGPSSSVRVLGGKAQNKLRFAEIRQTTGLAATQWTISIENGGIIRATWSGGPDPSVGKVNKDDYVNIYGTAFSAVNRGTFTITNSHGGVSGEAYVEWENPTGVSETTAQGNDEGILFFSPERKTLVSKNTFAAAFQTENRLLEVFMPATTKVVRRNRIGSTHFVTSGSGLPDELGPYIYDITKAYVIGGEECETTQLVDGNAELLITVNNASDIPDKQGHLVFGFGTSREEGPVPYTARPSSTQLLLNPSYVFENSHPSGTNISLISQNFPFDPATDGTSYQSYITDVVAGRLYAEELIRLVAATGIQLVFYILYPGDTGLGHWGTVNSEITKIFGPDPV